VGDEEEDDAGTLPVDPSLLDPSSGLYAQPFFLASLRWRLVACRRVLRPLAVSIIEVIDGLPDGPISPSDPNVVSAKVFDTLRGSDIGARLGDGSYGLLLEGTPEDGAVWAIERLRRSLVTRPGGRTMRAGVACYPGHALTATELWKAVTDAFDAARQWPQDRIEVASA
jgi:hypothetical protein